MSANRAIPHLLLVVAVLGAALPVGAGRVRGAAVAAEVHPAKRGGACHGADLVRRRLGPPPCFETNLRQADSQARFLSRRAGRSLLLTPTGMVFGSAGAAVGMRFVGANPQPRIAGLDEAPARVSSFVGSDPRRWEAGTPTYQRVAYGDLYPGVDAVFYGNGGTGVAGDLEYDFVVASGVDPGLIRLEVSGAERLLVEGNGDLVIRAASGEVRQRRPLIYQWESGERRMVAGRYVLMGEREVGFEVGAYDAAKPLVIDPVVAFSTYLGGNAVESVGAVEVDAAGNVYVTGWTASTDFPVTGPAQGANGGGEFDIFITKLGPQGDMLFSTYLGGVGRDIGKDVRVDAAGNVYLLGEARSSDFPTTANAYQRDFNGSLGSDDCVIVRLGPNGDTLEYSTFLGGIGSEDANGIELDSAGNVYVTGTATHGSFPTTSGSFQPSFQGENDVFVTKLNAAGSRLVYSTFVGGTATREVAYDIDLDASGAAYIAGSTNGAGFPTRNALQPSFAGGDRDAFVAKLDPTGSSLVYSTYLGGSGDDFAFSLDTDAGGSAWVAGWVASTDFPTAAPFQAAFGGGGFDAFVAKLGASGNTLSFSTYLGSTGHDLAHGVAVDPVGRAYVTGDAGAADFPVTADAFQAAYGGSVDAFVTVFGAAGGSPIYSSFFGGSGTEEGLAVASSAGNIAVAGITGGANFPLHEPSQAVHGGGSFDVFVAKVGFTPGPPPPVIERVEELVRQGRPYRIRIVGSTFQEGVQVFIGGDATPWPSVRRRGETVLVLKKGDPLADRFPPGEAVEIRVVNPDGGEASTTFTR
jgi:hypothetical protein